MPRNITYTALTLRVKASGESNRETWFLTAEEGIVKATVFGGPKSRLRSRVAPFHEGTLWVYHDPVRDSRKVSDFDVRSYRQGIRELYERVITADAVAQTILESSGGGGNWHTAARLAAGVLDGIAGADAALCTRLGVYFLWHWADILGIRPDLAACAACGNQTPRNEPLHFHAANQALLCGDCSQGEDEYSPPPSRRQPIKVSPGARLWLGGIENLPPESLARFTLDNTSLEQAKTLSKAVLTQAFEKRLPTWDGI